MAKTSSKNRRIPPSKPAVSPDGGIDLQLEEPDTRPTGSKNLAAKAIRETDVLDSVAGLDLGTVSSSIASTQVEVQKSLADLSAKLVERMSLLKNVEEAIQLKNDELKQLYNLEAKEIELDDLRAEIDRQREEWDEEQARKQRELAEQQSERNKQWKREEEDYRYRWSQEQRKIEDTFKEKMEGQEKANRNKQELIEKNWTERETELTETAETEFAGTSKAKVGVRRRRSRRPRTPRWRTRDQLGQEGIRDQGDPGRQGSGDVPETGDAGDGLAQDRGRKGDI